MVYHGREGKRSEILAAPSYSKIRGPIKKDGDNPVNQSKHEVIYLHAADTKRGKMCTREPRLRLVSLLIG